MTSDSGLYSPEQMHPFTALTRNDERIAHLGFAKMEKQLAETNAHDPISRAKAQDELPGVRAP